MVHVLFVALSILFTGNGVSCALSIQHCDISGCYVCKHYRLPEAV